MATKETSHHVEDEALEKVVGSIGKDQDDAGAFIAQTGGVFEYSAKEANIVRWKLDLILLPMVSILLEFTVKWKKLTCVDDNYLSSLFYG